MEFFQSSNCESIDLCKYISHVILFLDAKIIHFLKKGRGIIGGFLKKGRGIIGGFLKKGRGIGETKRCDKAQKLP